MNCKAGDLAMVITGVHGFRGIMECNCAVGIPVRVTQLDTQHPTHWQIESPLHCPMFDIPIIRIADDVLKPFPSDIHEDEDIKELEHV
jgi:hypothetical protein